jgi:outer membrane protein assembly factor BamB
MRVNIPTITSTLILLCLACGAAPAEEPAHPRIEWAFQSDGPIRSSAVVAGDHLYFGSADSFLYALAKRDGALRWKHAVGSPIVASPAVAAGLVIVASRGRDVFALDEADGQVKWSFRTQPALPTTLEWSYFSAAPVVSGNEVFVGSGDGHLYALDVASGRLQWQFATSGRIYAAPLVTDDFVYLASGDDHVYALSRKDGSVRWKYATAGTGYDLSQGFTRSGIFTQPVLSHGTLIFGSRVANVYALVAATGAKGWTFAYDTTWAMSVAVRDRTVFVGWSTNDRINALDLASGKQLWEFDAGSHTYTKALLRDDNAYWGSANGSVYCLNAKDGTLRWRYRAGSDIQSSLIEDDGRFYFGTDDGRLLALVADAPAPARAVYLPSAVPANLQGFVIDPALGPYFVGKGYKHLDSPAALAQWISAQTAAGSPSVIVFGYAQIPPAVMGEDPASGPLRRYLESGGKVVWPWGIPNHYVFDDQGTLVSADPGIGEKLLDLKFVPFEDSGNYYSRATQIGRNWGMSSWLRTCFSYVVPGSELTALATDELGRVGAFVKTFHPRSGSGWVSYGAKGFGVPITDTELAMLARVAAYGID